MWQDIGVERADARTGITGGLMKVRLIGLLMLAVVGFSVACHRVVRPPDRLPVAPLQARHDHSEVSFYFVHLTDTHFEDDRNFSTTEEIVARINALPMPIEFVVHTGDITSHGMDDSASLDRGLRILDRLTMPIFFVPGNHDISRRRLESTAQAYTQRLGPWMTSVEIHGVTFVFIYTEPLADDVTIPGYDPIGMLADLLEKLEDRPVIVCHHTPSVPDFYRNRMHSGWDEPIRQKWVDLLNAHHVKAVLAGHFHRDEHHWLGDVPLYVGASVSNAWGRQPSFRIFEYRDEKLTYRTQYLD